MSKDMLDLLNYMYNDFAITFVMCLCGALIKDVFETYKNTTKINVRNIILTSIFTTIVLCAIRVSIDIQFNVYILVCVVSGMWGDAIVNVFTNSEIMIIFFKKIVKTINNPLSDAIDDTIKELEKEEDKDHKDE